VTVIGIIAAFGDVFIGRTLTCFTLVGGGGLVEKTAASLGLFLSIIGLFLAWYEPLNSQPGIGLVKLVSLGVSGTGFILCIIHPIRTAFEAIGAGISAIGLDTAIYTVIS
jgi:hypothetical protein